MTKSKKKIDYTYWEREWRTCIKCKERGFQRFMNRYKSTKRYICEICEEQESK